jgi:hypothetical protein
MPPIRERLLELPPADQVSHPAIRKAMDAYRDFAGQLTAARAEHKKADAAVLPARKTDDKAGAEARRAGKKSPGPRAEQAARDAVAKAAREVRELEQAVADLSPTRPSGPSR